MLESVRLKNFKCYSDEKIGFSNLTVFSGMNSAGKSTIIQALLYLRQLYFNQTLSEGSKVNLNGDVVSFGKYHDLLPYWLSGKGDLSVEIEVAEAVDNALHDTVSLRLDRRLTDISVEPTHMIVGRFINQFSSILFSKEFSYLSSNRITPEDWYKLPREETILTRFGIRGELSPFYLADNISKPIRNVELATNLIGDVEIGEASDTLGVLLSFCYSKLGSNVVAVATRNAEIGVALLRYTSISALGGARLLLPCNVGFGLTNCLPVLLSLLAAKPNEMVVIENPESYLHPKGQVAMGQLMAKVAATGVQVLIETHSDHILNGIRLAVKKGDISPEQTKLNFIADNSKESGAVVFSPKISKDGRIDVWPTGFFDEYDNVLAELL